MGKRALTRNSITVFTAVFISSACTFVFLVMMGRFMTLDAFGSLNALLSIQLIFSVFTGALILLYTRHTAKLLALGLPEKVWGFYPYAWRLSFAVGLIAGGLVFISSLLWKDAVNIDTYGMVLMASFLIVVYFLQAAPLGFIRGMQKFRILAVGLSVSGVLKVVLAALFILVGITVTNALFVVFLSVVLSLTVMTLMIRPFRAGVVPVKDDLGKEEMFTFCLRAVAATFFPIFFINADMILIRSLIPHASGYYAAFMVVGKVIFLFAQVVAIALFPATVHGEVIKKENGNELISRAVLLVLLAGGAFTGISFLFPAEIMWLLFKINDPAATGLLPYYCVMVLAVSVFLIEGNYRLARGRYAFLWLAAVVAFLEVIGIFHFSGSLEDIVGFMVILFWVAAGLLMIGTWTEGRTFESNARKSEGV